MQKNIVLIIAFLLLGFFLVNPVKVEALGEPVIMHELADEDSCEGILGSPSDKDSVAYFLQQIFNVIKYLGPLLCLIFSVIDFVKAAASQDKEALAKAAKTTLKRIVLAMILFFIPLLINFLFPLIGFYGTCGIG
jgi:hypothetical protein